MSLRLAALKTWNATGGALLAALGLSAVMLVTLPVSRELAFAIAAHAVVPLWVTLACLLPLLVRRR